RARELVEVLDVLEQESRVDDAAEPSLEIAVHAESIFAAEDGVGRGQPRICCRRDVLRVAHARFAIQEELVAPNETAVRGLAERRVAVGEVEAEEVPALVVLTSDFLRGRITD